MELTSQMKMTIPTPLIITNGVAHVPPIHWSELGEFIRSNIKGFEYIYRGHKLTSWDLKPSFYRKSRKITVVDHLLNFKRASQGKLGSESIRHHLKDDQWWGLGQHYGLETPLLDWSLSPFVALFFAFESENNTTENRAVWALYAKHNLEFIQNEIRSKNLSYKDDFTYVDPIIDSNQRMQNQSGVFLRYNNDVELESWVRTNRPGDTTGFIIKIEVKNQDREDCLRELNRMNINNRSIYPDLEGAGKYCNLKSQITEYY